MSISRLVALAFVADTATARIGRRIIFVAILLAWWVVADPVYAATAHGVAPTGTVAHPTRVEVFTAGDRPVHGLKALAARGIRVTVYRIDDITRINALLSLGLPADATRAASMALERIQHNRPRIERRYARCAHGLLRAVQYRLDRYPAVVFDGRAIVYGLTDLGAAVDRYRAWVAEGRP